MPQLAVVTRSNRIECIHEGHLCVSRHNNVFLTIGDDAKIYMRSTAKPFLATLLIRLGAMKQFDISLKELAVICSSHSGQYFHLKSITSLLNKIGLNESHLLCGSAYPYNEHIKNELIRKDQRPSSLHNCCAGKHAGMLAVCRLMNYPIEEYNLPSHPVQQLYKKTMAELLECGVNEIETGVDGCAVPSYMLKLSRIAKLYALLAQGYHGQSPYKDSLGVIQEAMLTYPEFTEGYTEFCTELSIHSRGQIIGKVGTDGVYCLAIPHKELGIAIKITDGSERAIYPVVVHLLKRMNIITDDCCERMLKWAYPRIVDHLGTTQGYILPVFDLNPAKKNFLSLGEPYEWSDERCSIN